MLRDAKIGDELYSPEHGWGVVIEKSKGTYALKGTHALLVKFKNYKKHFLSNGKSSTKSTYPTLFWDEIKFEIPEKPLPKIEVDTKVLVWDEIHPKKYKRYFKEFNEYGKIVCFMSGSTSWSANDKTDWEYWELAE